MTLPASGTMTIQMINLEMQRPATQAFSFQDTEVMRLAGKTAGQLISLSDFYGKTYEYVAVTTGDVNQQVVQNYFTAAQWSSAVPKRLINYHQLYSNNPAVPGLRTGSGRGGTLIIENRGGIYGAGGAPNGGQGGDAFAAQQSGVTILNYGNIFGGGGAGGYGGVGGTGVWYNSYTVYEPSDGSYVGSFAAPKYYWRIPNGSGDPTELWWGNTYLGAPGSGDGFSTGGWTYYRDYSSFYNDGRNWHEEVRRQRVQSDPNYTSGGAGGTGGYGTGIGAGSATGQNGSGGGTNAGAGGKGGNGGGWGLSGAAGAAGAAGNAGGGNSGGPGGLAGLAINNSTATTTLSAQAGSDVRGR